MPDYLTTSEAAARLGLGPRTVQRLVKSGILPARQFGRVFLIDARDLHHAHGRRPVGRPRRTSA